MPLGPIASAEVLRQPLSSLITVASFQGLHQPLTALDMNQSVVNATLREQITSLVQATHGFRTKLLDTVQRPNDAFGTY